MSETDNPDDDPRRVSAKTRDFLPKELMMEGRLMAIETHLGYLKEDVGELKVEAREIRHTQERDFRLLFGCLIAVALGLAGLLAKGFHWI